MNDVCDTREARFAFKPDRKTNPDRMPAMILGQSLFDAVLDRLAEEREGEPDEEHVAAPAAGIRGLNAGFVSPSIGIPLPDGEGRLHDAYFDFDDQPSRTEKPAPEPVIETAEAHLFSRLTPQDVAEDLKLSGANSAEALHSLRRSFARQNHPDMVGEAWRDQATLRMKIANLLIDEALKRLPPAGR
ncbi:hypothetical protein [Rhizobium sp. C4]|uniref:hypothetical protein n=1 Tax=Rhizobium sp. C4 TaxID=1349800 RepID=UPI001E2C821F|nr:hypothetical protein [Rhizobium sp. C4]MCD2173926.1 hypothetical protein [Rhizobium sp. C4]